MGSVNIITHEEESEVIKLKKGAFTKNKRGGIIKIQIIFSHSGISMNLAIVFSDTGGEYETKENLLFS